MPNIDLTQDPQPEQVALVTDWLSRANYRVIRPLQTRTSFSTNQPPEKLITVAILDTETTGINQAKDKIIELGMVLVEICPESGQAYRVTKVFDELEYPGMPIPEESTRVHHITDEMVAGKRIDDAEVEALMASVSLVVAHNAGFDRVFVEERFPIFATKAWACSFRQIPWSEEGMGSASLEFLAYRCGFHFTGHRATTDCHALLEVLQETLPTSGSLAMQVLLQNARIPEIKVTALSSPFETKDVLKERSYRWNAEKKAWAKSIPKQVLEEEVAWLKASVYSGKGFRLELEKMTAMNRFSNRPGAIEVVKYE
ncbi:MAG: 3'-5' exonuclease [Betaproteobacteria bacterium]